MLSKETELAAYLACWLVNIFSLMCYAEDLLKWRFKQAEDVGCSQSMRCAAREPKVLEISMGLP